MKRIRTLTIILWGFSKVILAQDCVWNQTFFIENEVCNHNTKLKLVFEDNFDSTFLDSTKWQDHFPWGRHLVGTSLISYNTEGDNMELRDGLLIFTIRKEDTVANVRDYREPGCIELDIGDCILEDGVPNRRAFQYSSAMIWSKERFGHGKFEIRCRIPRIDGTVSAFWLYGGCGDELDVFEFRNHDINTSSSVSGRIIHMANHRLEDCSNRNPSCSMGKDYRAQENLSNDFHTYSVEHDGFRRTWRFDNEIIRVIYNYKNMLGQDIKGCGDVASGIYLKDPSIITTTMNIIAGAGVKTFCYPEICDRGVFPLQMEIDYIKVWERVPGVNSTIIYPNPNHGAFKIEVEDTSEKITAIFVFASTGLLVYRSSNLNVPIYEVELEKHMKGMYFVHTYIEDRLFVQKIILE